MTANEALWLPNERTSCRTRGMDRKPSSSTAALNGGVDLENVHAIQTAGPSSDLLQTLSSGPIRCIHILAHYSDLFSLVVWLRMEPVMFKCLFLLR